MNEYDLYLKEKAKKYIRREAFIYRLFVKLKILDVWYEYKHEVNPNISPSRHFVRGNSRLNVFNPLTHIVFVFLIIYTTVASLFIGFYRSIIEYYKSFKIKSWS